MPTDDNGWMMESAYTVSSFMSFNKQRLPGWNESFSIHKNGIFIGIKKHLGNSLT